MVVKFHGYQAKNIFTETGIPVPESRLTSSVREAMGAVEEIGYPTAIKTQVHIGGYGKVDDIKITTDEGEVRQAIEDILGIDFRGYTAGQALVETGVDFEDELYTDVTINRSEGKPVTMVSTEDGVNIEGIAEGNPDAITRKHIDLTFDLHPYQVRRVVPEVDIPRNMAFGVTSFLTTLYNLYESNDASGVKIDPVMITSDCDIVTADAVMSIDDNTPPRHDDLAAMEESTHENDLETKTGEYGFDYVRLSGNIGIIGNSAGLVVTTLGPVDYFGGKPANSLDIGDGAKAERVTNALDMVFPDENVDSVVFNILGSITRDDRVTKGISGALGSFNEIPKPIAVRPTSTNTKEGMGILNTDLIRVEGTLEGATRRAVKSAQEVS